MSPWVLVKHLTLFPTDFSRRNWLLIAWIGYTVHWVKSCLDGRAQSHSEWISVWLAASHQCSQGLRIWPGFVQHFYQRSWLGDAVAPSVVSLQLAPSWVGMLVYLSVGKLCRGTWIGWINGPCPVVWPLAGLNVGCCTRVATTPRSAGSPGRKGLGGAGQQPADHEPAGSLDWISGRIS